uniref:NADH-ubiquinone oxidoreductase chain 4 n=1 Tax=Hydropsyche pellucidula TaxID=869943 RepID=A0A0U3E144_9NEOP|nr:NADH dehydrogenase subunit 4 [Hydropsyche pellucidula]ALT58519.1 NADH dehydrogenase subunit 4 [Hydropsyche pellucidula]
MSMFLIYFKWWEVFISMYLFFFFFFMNSLNLFYWVNLFNFLGFDFLSFSMILLSIWICGLIILSSFNLYTSKKFYDLFNLNLLFLLFCLVLAFSSLDILYFYVFFEMSILPVLFMIMGWGYQPERLQAGIYLVFYTLCVSLPLLLGIFYIYKIFYSFSFMFFSELGLMILYFLMILAFLVKMPMFIVHLWLPKAHVEGPVSSSMILAGVMLKLGGYGLVRVMKLMVLISLKMNIIWVVLSLIGGTLISLMCLHQMDMKLLIAYSSVVHMALVIAGIMTLTYLGFTGSLILMIGHGLCSSGLFVLINLMYERLSSRSLMINKGLINLLPNLSLWWFLLLSSNMAAPPSMNLFGEISLLMSIISWSGYMMIFLMLISFFSAGYSLYIFAFSQHGKFFHGIYNFSSINLREYLLLFCHWVPLNLLIFKIDYFFFWL